MNVYRIKCLIIYSKLYKSPNDQRVLKFLFFVFVLVYLKTLKKENNYFFQWHRQNFSIVFNLSIERYLYHLK